MERKLAAILSADVEGYSRLMGEDEEATIRTLNFYRQQMTVSIQGHRGRVVDSPGDNLLAEFGSVVDAVKCAAIIQTTLRMENADLPQNRRMEFRIGINLGDVVVDGERILGDGVNIAARVEGLADGGGICISGTVFDHIKGKVSVTFEDLGLQQVKNIAEPIRAYRAVLGSGPESARPQQKIEVPRQDLRQEISNLYKTLMARLSPLLYRGIDDVLQRRKTTFNLGGDLNFVVVAPINGFYRVVGATFSAEHPMRQNNTKLGEGMRGFFAERKVAGYVRPGGVVDLKEGNRPIFDRTGQILAEAPPRRDAGILTPPVETKWRYFSPIFEKSAANPWSNRVVGIINVQSPADDADSLFKTAEFQQQVDSIATEVSPYLDAIQVLTGEEKL
jgi:class 3 adenylate cyclase